MFARTYQDCYRTLHARSDFSWDELRLAYRRRVRQCHPDLFNENSRETCTGRGRDEEFRRVILAYRLIASYHLRHGTLPPAGLGVHETPSRHAAWAQGSGNQPGKEGRESVPRRAPLRTPMVHVASFVAFVAGVSTAALYGTYAGDNRSRTDSELHGNQLAIGMDSQTVVETQGMPNYTAGSVWFYGESGVFFSSGCVIGWENQPPFPLRTLIAMSRTHDGVRQEPWNSTRADDGCLLKGH